MVIPLLTVATVGCTSRPGTRTHASATPSASPSPRYNVAGLDLCNKLDRKPLAKIHWKTDNATPGPKSSPFMNFTSSAECTFTSRDYTAPVKHDSDIDVGIEACNSSQYSDQYYSHLVRDFANDKIRIDGPIVDLGDSATGFAGVDHPGLQSNSYYIIARKDNLVITAYFDDIAPGYASPRVLKSVTRAVAANLIQLAIS